ncbi:tetratricopeptide repeat protein [bacterium]|nr:tetratricopeptide repeat protein [bacterium]
MKKLNKIFILLALLSFISCGTASTASSYDSEKPEGSYDTVSERTASETASESSQETSDVSEKQPESASEAVVVESAETTAEAGSSAPEEEKNPNYDGNKYVGPATADFEEGLRAYSDGGCEKAVKFWQAAFSKDQRNAQIAFNTAVCFERMKNREDAAAWYEKAYLADNAFTKPLYNLALLYMPDQIKEKEGYLTQLAEKNADVVEKYNFMAWLNLQLGRNNEAEKYAKMVLKEDEQNSEAVISLATSYFSKKMYELAESALETAEKWDPENFRLQRLYGFLLYRTGDSKGATTHLMKSVKTNPDQPEVRNILAILAMKIEDYSTAKDQLEAALKIKDDFWTAKLNLALAYKGLEDYKNAAVLLDELEARNDLQGSLRNSVIFNKALLYLDADVAGDKNPARFDTAVKYFNDYMKLIAKSKNFKEQKALVDGYIKEAKTEKKKLEFALAAKAKAEKRKQAQEEEARLFKEHKEAAFKQAEEANTAEAWSKFLEEYPVVDENDTLSLSAKAKLEELTPKAPEQPENQEAAAPAEATAEAPAEAAPEQKPEDAADNAEASEEAAPEQKTETEAEAAPEQENGETNTGTEENNEAKQ